MIYICYRQGSSRYTNFEVMEFETKRKALNYLEDKPKTRVIGIFDGKRLNPTIGEKKIVKKVITDFSDFTDKSQELKEENL